MPVTRLRRGHPLASFALVACLAFACDDAPATTPTVASTPPPSSEPTPAPAPKPAPPVVTPRAAAPPLAPVVVNPSPDGRPLSFADLVERVRPAVVNIYTTSRGVNDKGLRRYLKNQAPNGLPDDRLLESLGSGFLINADGYILTNHHVIEGASFIKVRLYDGREFEATNIGADPKTDIALIKINPAPDLVTLQLGDSSAARVGDWVVAIGNPLGLASTVTAGIISARGRKDVPLGGEITFMDFIQTDASINPGNSGGPLIDLTGQVVGINTAISRQGQGIGFAIPINMARDILTQLMNTGHVIRSWVGVHVEPLTTEAAQERGIDPGLGTIVNRTVIGSPAHRAGLQGGDVVTHFNDQPILGVEQLHWLASTVGVGVSVSLRLLREGRPVTLTLVTEAQPPDP